MNPDIDDIWDHLPIHADGMSFEEIAALEGCSRTRIEQIYKRALEKLRRQLSGEIKVTMLCKWCDEEFWLQRTDQRCCSYQCTNKYSTWLRNNVYKK